MTQPTAFLFGWLQLPEELKLTILRYAVPTGKRLNKANFNANRRSKQVQRMRQHASARDKPDIDEPLQFDINVLPLLACFYTSYLVYDAFYTQNTWTTCVY